MNREINNPIFRFLFEDKNPAHIYYRWRIYSVLQGEQCDQYRTDDFRMFRNGSIWRPPKLNPYVDGLAETDSEDEQLPFHEAASRQDDGGKNDGSSDKIKGELSQDDRDFLEDTLRNLLPRQKTIGEAMVFCLQHADWAEEIVQCITESLSLKETPLTKKVARMYLISDILYNSSAKVSKASFFRKHFETKLELVMQHVHTCHEEITGRLRAEQFKQKILKLFRVWDEWSIYPENFLVLLQNIFLGLVTPTIKPLSQDDEAEEVDEEIDGIPLDDNIDGSVIADDDSDIDGMPLDTSDGAIDVNAQLEEQIDVEPDRPRFVQSKWETVDPEDVESQAMTTSKWDTLIDDEENDDEDVDGDPIDACSDLASTSNTTNTTTTAKGGCFEERGLDLNKVGQSEAKEANTTTSNDKLREEIPHGRKRELENKVVKFQDELESGKRATNPESTIEDQVTEYRRKLYEREIEKSKKPTAASSREKRKDRKRPIDRSSDNRSDSSGERSRKKRKARGSSRRSPTPPSRRGIVPYDTAGSSDESRRKSSKKDKTKKERSSLSRSRKRSPRSSSRNRRNSRSPNGGSSSRRASDKRSSRSRSGEKKSKRRKH